MENINNIIIKCKEFFERSYIIKTNFESDLLELLDEEIITFEEYKQINQNKELYKNLIQY